MKPSSTLSNGRTVIPAALREQLDIRDGDQLIWSIGDGALIATTRRAQLRKAQAMVAGAVPPGRSLVDELLADRKAEQAAEDARR